VIASHHWSPLEGAASANATCCYGEKPDGTPVFVKRYHDPDDDAIVRLTEEVNLLRQVADCPNVIMLVGVGRTRTDEYCLVFEMAAGMAAGSLEGEQHFANLAAAVDRDIRAALTCLLTTTFRGQVAGEVRSRRPGGRHRRAELRVEPLAVVR
jgi:hypothetical protein